jgi:hypothetical protein
MAEERVHRRFRTIPVEEEHPILLEVGLGCLWMALAFSSSSSWISTGAGMKTAGGATAPQAQPQERKGPQGACASVTPHYP